MTISKRALFFGALFGIITWLIILTIVVIVHEVALNAPSPAPAQQDQYVPSYGINPDGTTYEQAPDLSGQCITYDGDYTNDTCPSDSNK